MKRTAALFLALALVITAVQAQLIKKTDPLSVIQRAYTTANSYYGTMPNTLTCVKSYFTPDLYAALLKRANQPVPNGKAPDRAGEVLFGSPDLPVGFGMESVVIEGTTAHVSVSLEWITATRQNDKRRYDVQLVQIDGAWKIADIDYGKAGKLSAMLK